MGKHASRICNITIIKLKGACTLQLFKHNFFHNEMQRGETFFHLKKLKTIYVKLISTLLWTACAISHLCNYENTKKK